PTSVQATASERVPTLAHVFLASIQTAGGTGAGCVPPGPEAVGRGGGAAGGTELDASGDLARAIRTVHRLMLLFTLGLKGQRFPKRATPAMRSRTNTPTPIHPRTMPAIASPLPPW